MPPGAAAEDNVEVRRWGAPRAFPSRPPHWEIGESLGILDFERAARLAKARFTVLWGHGARLERALAQFMLDLHTGARLPGGLGPAPRERGDDGGDGQLPKFEEELFKTVEPEGAARSTSSRPPRCR